MPIIPLFSNYPYPYKIHQRNSYINIRIFILIYHQIKSSRTYILFLVSQRMMRNLNFALVLALTILSCLLMGKSSLLLHDEVETLDEKDNFVNSLRRGPVPPSGPSGCTHIPGSAGNPCPIDNRWQRRRISALNGCFIWGGYSREINEESCTLFFFLGNWNYLVEQKALEIILFFVSADFLLYV